MRAIYVNLASKIEKYFRVDARYFLSGGFWLLVSQATTVLSSLVVAILFANNLSESDYGIYRYVIGLAVIFGAFSLTGISQAIMQASSKNIDVFFSKSTRTTLLYGLITSGAALIGSLYYYINDNNTLAIGCLLIALLHPVTQLFLNTLSHLYGKANFKTGTYIQAGKSFFVSAASIFALLFSENIIVLLLVYFITQAVSSIICYLVFKPNPKNQTITEPEFTKYQTYAKHTSVRNIFSHVSNQFDTVFIFQQLGAVELAVYSIASLIPSHVRGSFKNLQSLLIPKYAKHDSDQTIKGSIPKRSLQFFILLSLLSVAFIFIVPYLYALLFPTYTEAVLYAQLLALAFPASIALIPFGALQVLQREKELYIFQIGSSIVQLFSVVTLIIFFGLIGAIAARVIFQYFRAMLAYYLLYKK